MSQEPFFSLLGQELRTLSTPAGFGERMKQLEDTANELGRLASEMRRVHEECITFMESLAQQYERKLAALRTMMRLEHL